MSETGVRALGINEVLRDPSAALVHPIRWTTLGLSPHEAMHFRMPVVALADVSDQWLMEVSR